MDIQANNPLRRLRRSQDGATAIEFAFIAPLLMLLVMGVMELGMLLTAQSIMETATFSASRLGKTGFVDTDTTQEETIVAEIGRIGQLFLDPDEIEVTSLSYAAYDKVGEPEPFVDANSNGVKDPSETYNDVNGNGEYDLDQGASGFGGAEQIVVYTTTYDWTLFTPLMSSFLGNNGIVELSARAVVKNEPFS